MTAIDARNVDAVLFDLDGVLTRTADIHAAAWKALFDTYLQQRARERDETFVPFDIDADYKRYLDGKPRVDGTVAFLASRGIDTSDHAQDDQAHGDWVERLAAAKDAHFNRQLEQQGVRVFESAIDLVHQLRALDVKTAVVSSSRSCAAILQAAHIDHLFDERVDGNDVIRLGLSGKPAADSFLEAAQRLSVDPSRAVVIEDAVAGVQAARAGAFGLIIGVGGQDDHQTLRTAGADVVVTDLAQVLVIDEPASTWSLVYDAFDLEHEGIRESLCTLANGYFSMRGALPWVVADDHYYPGTYLAGGYNRLRSDIEGRSVENEDLVNLPNGLLLKLRVGDDDWIAMSDVTLLSYRQTLDLRRGTLVRDIRLQDGKGRISTIQERRLVSMHNKHLAAMEIRLTAENWSGTVTLCSGIDGQVINEGAELYRKFNKKHLEPLSTQVVDDVSIALQVRTSQSMIGVALAARTQISRDGASVAVEADITQAPGYIAQTMAVPIEQGQTVTVEKVVALHTSRDPAISEFALASRKTLAHAAGFSSILKDHELAWKNLWRRFDIHLRPTRGESDIDHLMLLRLNMFHLLQTVSPQSVGLDIGVPSRGWTGEAYQGHIFWDELFIFPFFNLRLPQISRSLLMYRVRRLDEARAAARRIGLQGAMFPWQSASDGQEETQQANLNPRSNRWVPDNSYLQRHVGSAIVYNVWQYFQVTTDFEFMQSHGAELVLEVARFWASMTTFDEAKGRYEICGVMGPDEFHDAYPGASTPGINNNAYTNVLAVWVFGRALETLALLPLAEQDELMCRLALTRQDLARWRDITQKMYVPFHDGVISQFEGYEQLQELDWDAYRAKYDNIQRLDLILEAEDDSPNRYRASKQPDVLMLFYLFSTEELAGIFAQLDYDWDDDLMRRSVEYYDRRSSHGSTLSRVVMAWVHARTDRQRSMQYFSEALKSDVCDIQQGSTSEGIHLGAMAGSVDLVERVSTGIETEGGVLQFNPALPPELSHLDMRIHYRGHALDIHLTRESLLVQGQKGMAQPINVRVQGRTHRLDCGAAHRFTLA